MGAAPIVVLPLLLAAVALLAFQRGYLAARRHDDARVRLLVDVVTDAMAVVGDRSASDAVVRRLAQVLDADATAVGYVEAGRLTLFGTHGYDARTRPPSLAKGEGLSGRAWAEARPLVVADVRREPGYLPGADGVRSGLYVPGHARGRVTLVVCAESRRAGAFGAKDLAVVEPLADLLAAMLESRRMLREAEQLEEHLLTLVGHEMRTPLTTIFGSLTTLRHYAERVDPIARGELLDAGLRAYHRLERLVDALLMAARIDADEVTFRRTPVRVHGVVADAVTAGALAGRVAIDVPASVGVTADPVHLGTVVRHLVENAVVHGGAGPVEVVASDDGAGTVTIEVRDDGPGIAAELQRAALGRFRRIGTHTAPGTGLGLYLARRLVEGMGGELTLRSAPGAGCTVSVRLPAAVSAALAEAGAGQGAAAAPSGFPEPRQAPEVGREQAGTTG